MPRSPRPAIVLALAVVASVAAPPAGALQGYANGHLVNAWCTREEPVDVEACLSYLRGVFDTVAAVQSTRAHDDHVGRGDVDESCIPGHVPVTQIRIVFVRYARNHPDELALQAAVVVLRALRDAFPCVPAK